MGLSVDGGNYGGSDRGVSSAYEGNDNNGPSDQELKMRAILRALDKDEFRRGTNAYPNSGVALQGSVGSGSDAFKAGRDSFITTVDQRGPGFFTSHGFDPETGKMFQEFHESPEQQALTDSRFRIAESLGSYGEGIAGGTGSGDPIEQALRGDLAGGRDAYEKAVFDRAMSLLGPQLQGQYDSARSNLVNTGNPIGTERSRFELDQLNRNQSAQRSDLALGSVIAGLEGQGQQISNLNNYSQGKTANLGNIFNIMKADRPNYFVPGQLVGGNAAMSGATAGKQGSSALGTVGTVAGGVIGAYFGGPAGAAAGAQIGGAAGNAASG